MLKLALGAALAVLLASACSDDDTCTPGAQVSCACPGGEQGIQVCAADGSTYDACSCGSTSSSSGTGGAGGSAPLCETYCETVHANCSNQGSGDNTQYAAVAACLDVCVLLPFGSPGNTSGNTIECRLHYAREAGSGDPAEHCPAAGPGGNGVCGLNCESFCTIAASTCPDQFASVGDCITACAAFPGSNAPYVYGDTSDSYSCRLDAAISAVVNGPETCPAIAVDSPSCN